MKLSKKTFVYSMMLASVLILFVIGYFIFMLPSLYIDYMGKLNLNSIIATQRGYLETKSYDNLPVNNPTGCFTIDIPKGSNQLCLVSKLYKITVTIHDQALKDELDKICSLLTKDGLDEEIDTDIIDFSMMKEKLMIEKLLAGKLIPKDYPLDYQFYFNDYTVPYDLLSQKVHMISDNLMVFEGSVTDGINHYTSYMALSNVEGNLVISFLPVMSPQIEEIKPVIMGSLPMIISVVLLLVLIFSIMFAKHIVTPIIRLAFYTEEAKSSIISDLLPLPVKGKDEISMLAASLNELYEKLSQSYLSLEEKNERLEETAKTQEVFLRASSHQLKTPVAAALLLTDGMMNEVGKYKDIHRYLPEVKKQLKSMQKIIEDILYLNHCSHDLHEDTFKLDLLAEKCLENYRYQIADKNLHIASYLTSAAVTSDPAMAEKIIDNLISNAVQYTPEGNEIELTAEKNRLIIRNYGVTIENEILKDIYEPFVSSNSRHKGHGLGLYVVSYYARLCGITVSISNLDNGVETILLFT